MDFGEVDDTLDQDLESPASQPADIEQTGQAASLLKDAPDNDEPIDMSDWEPTLF